MEKTMLCVFGVLGALDFGPKKHKGGAGCNTQQTKKKCYVCLEFQNHKVHHQCPTHAQVKNIRVKMFLKKFKNLKPKPTCASRGYTILYTRILTTITPREITHKTIERQVKKHKCKINELHN